MPLRKSKHISAKDWRHLKLQESRLVRSRRNESTALLNRVLAEKVPGKLKGTLDAAFAKAFDLVFSKGTYFIEKTYSKEKKREEFKNRTKSHSAINGKKSPHRMHLKVAKTSSTGHMLFAGVEGVGLGLLGIGIPDIPLFSAVLLRSIYNIATHFGFSYESEKEKDFILCLIAASLSKGDEFVAKNNEINEWIDGGTTPPWEHKVLLRNAAEALSDYLLYAKFVQGIPIVGALGGLSDSVCLGRVTKYSRIKYQRRYMVQGK